MTRPSHPRISLFFALSLFAVAMASQFPVAALAEDGAKADEGEVPWYALPERWKVQGWTLQTSLYTKHFDPDPEHNNNQNLIAVEALFERDWMIGAAVFDNSFGQPSQIVYLGKTWPLFGSRYWYGKVIAGLLHGYKEPYEDKIPFNGAGIAPAVVPAIGFRYKWLVVEGAFGGISTFTLTAGVTF